MAATDLTFKDVQDRVLTFGYGEVDRANVKVWVNMAYDDIISRRAKWSWLQASETVTTVAGTQTVSLTGLSDPPQVFGRLQPSGANQTGLTEPMYLDNMRFNDGITRRGMDSGWTGVPQWYTVWNQTITFYPIPDAVYTYNLFYWKGTPELSADGDKPLIPRQWRHVLVYGALRYAAEKDRSDSSIARRTAEYEKMIMNMIGMENEYQMETGQRAEMPDHYYGQFETPAR